MSIETVQVKIEVVASDRLSSAPQYRRLIQEGWSAKGCLMNLDEARGKRWYTVTFERQSPNEA